MLKVRTSSPIMFMNHNLTYHQFMAWERSFERRVEEIRARELRYQKKSYTIEVLFQAIWWVI